MSQCMQFTFGYKREVYLLGESALPVTEKESMQEGKKASALGWNMDTETLKQTKKYKFVWQTGTIG